MKLKVIYHYNDFDRFEQLVNDFINHHNIQKIEYKVDGSSCYAFIHYTDL
jgi:hypothetical protein